MVLERVDDDRHQSGSGGTDGDPSNDGTVSNGGGGGRYPESYGDGSAGHSFVYFQAILFTLLIVSPCFRAAYLWYAAGGRVHLRRNEQGRIVGLLYIPPVTHWFGHNHQPFEATYRVDVRLTEDQVMALPEIVFVMPLDEDHDGGGGGGGDPSNEAGGEDSNDNLNGNGMGTLKDQPPLEQTESMQDEPPRGEDVQIRISSGGPESDDDECRGVVGPPPAAAQAERKRESHRCSGGGKAMDPANVGSKDPVDEPPRLSVLGGDPPPTSPIVAVAPSKGDRSDEEQPGEDDDGTMTTMIRPARRRTHTTTTCTTCSICIDEFEQGEKVRLLPRCGHAFHTECILPWLTEQQGCCPLCKTGVLEKEEEGGGVRRVDSNEAGGDDDDDDDHGNNTEGSTDGSVSRAQQDDR
jgi:Ring finger domain